MGANILTAIKNIVEFNENDLAEYASTYRIRINAVGEQLEYYLKDAFSSSFKASASQKADLYEAALSYSGNQNNPPDIILKGGDAFEIKKVENLRSALALNSSPPKDRLHSDDTRIIESCKACDGGNWKEKDLFYIVGYAKEGKLQHLFFVHGRCYAASRDVYEKKSDRIKAGVNTLLETLGLESEETNELGKIKKVDPLGITELRVRGMWSIQNPVRVFSGICPIDGSKEFTIVALMSKVKYESFPKSDREALEKEGKIKVSDVKIPDPNNPAKALEAKLISSGW